MGTSWNDTLATCKAASREKDNEYYDSLPPATADDFYTPSPSMYSTGGDAAVRAFCELARQLAANDLSIRNKATLTEALRPYHAVLRDTFSEVTDTEPRAFIADKLDEICKANGWAFEKWEGYDL